MTGGSKDPHAPPAIKADGLPAGTASGRYRLASVKSQTSSGLHTRPPVFGGASCCLRLHVRFNEKNTNVSDASRARGELLHAQGTGRSDRKRGECPDAWVCATRGVVNNLYFRIARDVYRLPGVVCGGHAGIVSGAWLEGIGRGWPMWRAGNDMLMASVLPAMGWHYWGSSRAAIRPKKRRDPTGSRGALFHLNSATATPGMARRYRSTTQANGSCRTMVWSRSGPVETMLIGQPASSSSERR